MSRGPALLSVALAVAGISSIVYIVRVLAPAMTLAESVQTVVAVVATTGALISAVFVISAYTQSIRTFVEAHRPQLLIQVLNRHEENPESTSPTPITHFTYQNITANQFNHLTLHLTIEAYGSKVSLDDLFSPRMVMPGHDHRTKTFKPVVLANEQGLFLNTEVRNLTTGMAEPLPKLRIEYDYTYNGRMYRASCQEYVWNVKDQVWEIK